MSACDFFFSILFTEWLCSLSDNQVSNISAVEAFLKRNATFAEMKPRFLAFRLSSQFCEAHVPAEVWDVLSLEFALPLCFFPF